MEQHGGKRETWRSSVGFVLAAAGSAVGLGSIWRFPYITGENGGGAFVLVYLACIAVVALPVMLCEFVMGRRTQRNPVGAFRLLCQGPSGLSHALGVVLLLIGLTAIAMNLTQLSGPPASGGGSLRALSGWGWGIGFVLLGLAVFRWGWRVVGGMGVVAGFVILAFYSVVTGWTIGYTAISGTGRLNLDLDRQPPSVLATVLREKVRAPPDGFAAELARRGIAGAAAKAETQAASRRQQLAFMQAQGMGSAETLGGLPDADLDKHFAAQSTDWPRERLVRQVREAYGWADDSGAGSPQPCPGPLLTAIAGTRFSSFIGNPTAAIGCHFVCMLLCVVIVGLGVQKGIEAANKVLMPLLILIMLILIVRALTLPGAVAGVRFYLSPDFGKLNTQSVLIALGHAFFTLSLGMGAMITYGSYVDKEQNLFISALWVTGLDTLISVMSGLAIFPAVFAEGFMPDAGPGLVFQVLPAVFQRMAFGPLWATLFFLLLFVAALASAISLLEVVTAYLVDERHWRRVTAAVTFGIAIFLLGCVCAISVGDWQRVQWLGDAIRWLFGGCRASFFDLLDNLSCNWLLPLGGLFTCLFVGWVWGTRKAVDEIRKGSANFADVHLISLLAGLKDDHSHNSPVHVITLASMWGLFIRFVSPVAVLIAFLYTIGWLELGQTSQPPPPAPAQQAEQAGGSQQ